MRGGHRDDPRLLPGAGMDNRLARFAEAVAGAGVMEVRFAEAVAGVGGQDVRLSSR